MRFVRKIIVALIVAVACAAAIWLCCLNSRYIFIPHETAKRSSDIKIAALNICGFSYAKEAEALSVALVKLAEEKDIDIVLIQEFYLPKSLTRKKFADIAQKCFPYTSIMDECAVLSRIPLCSHEREKFPGSSSSYSSITFDSGKGKFRILALHLNTTGMYNYKNGRSVENTEDALRLGEILLRNGEIRIKQAEKVGEAVRESEIPVIVAGDFNALPLSKVYNLIKGKTLRDAFLEKGHGKGSTYLLLKDIFRIDYILHDRHFRCRDFEMSEKIASDHRMVVATLKKRAL